jgi:hypothetical protein
MTERAAAIQEVAEAVEHVGTAVDHLTIELGVARARTHAELDHLRKLTWMVIFGVAVLMVTTILGGYTLYLVNDTISPDGGRFKQNQTRTGEVITTLAIDGDCRSRRAAAGLLAPDPRAPCPSQTPTDVYPGVRRNTPGAPND